MPMSVLLVPYLEFDGDIALRPKAAVFVKQTPSPRPDETTLHLVLVRRGHDCFERPFAENCSKLPADIYRFDLRVCSATPDPEVVFFLDLGAGQPLELKATTHQISAFFRCPEEPDWDDETMHYGEPSCWPDELDPDQGGDSLFL